MRALIESNSKNNNKSKKGGGEMSQNWVVDFLIEEKCKSIPENFENAYWDVTFTLISAIIV